MQRYFINFLFLNGPIIIWISGLDLEVNYEFNFHVALALRIHFPRSPWIYVFQFLFYILGLMLWDSFH
jgi:hypothetical protein